MTFAAPLFLLAGLAAGIAIAALHLLARRDPRPWLLPTARFVPESSLRTASRSIRLTDRLLLLLRLAVIAAAALAFARPSVTLAKKPLIRLIVVDTSTVSAVPGDASRTGAALAGPDDRVVFAGDLSAGFVKALAEARALRDVADSMAIVIVSPLTRSSIDAATVPIRATWPGAIAWHRVESAVDTTDVTVSFRGPIDDPLRATAALGGIPLDDSAAIRLIRDPVLDPTDSSWASASTHRLIHWPADLRGDDTVGSVVGRRAVVVAALSRPRSGETPGTPIAWWVDGRPAASERRSGGGCIRTVAIPVPTAGDLALQERFRDLFRELIAPCGSPRDGRPVDSITRTAILGDGHPNVSAKTLPARIEAGRDWAPWLLGLAIVLLLTEQAFRRREPT